MVHPFASTVILPCSMPVDVLIIIITVFTMLGSAFHMHKNRKRTAPGPGQAFGRHKRSLRLAKGLAFIKWTDNAIGQGKSRMELIAVSKHS
jgi:hypothetical protein